MIESVKFLSSHTNWLQCDNTLPRDFAKVHRFDVETQIICRREVKGRGSGPLTVP